MPRPGRAGFADYAKSRRIESHAAVGTGVGAAVAASSGVLGVASLWQAEALAEAQAERVVPAPTVTRRYEIVHQRVLVRSEPHLAAVVLDSREQHETVACSELSVDGWVRLAGEPGWMLTHMRGMHGLGELMRSSSQRADLAVEHFHPQGLCCLDVVFKQVAVRKAPSRQAETLGFRRCGELVFTRSQSFNGWLRLHDSEGWMLTFTAEHGELLRPRFSDEVRLLDLHALCDVWASVRRTAGSLIRESEGRALKSLERDAALLADADYRIFGEGLGHRSLDLQEENGGAAELVAEGLLAEEDLGRPELWIRQRLFANNLARLAQEAPLPGSHFKLSRRPPPLERVARAAAVDGSETPKLAWAPPRAEMRRKAEAAKAAEDKPRGSAVDHLLRGTELARAALFDQASAAFSQGLALSRSQADPSVALAERTDLRCFRGRASCLSQLRDFPGLLHDSERLLAEGPDAEALAWRLVAREGMGQYEDALVDARALLRLDRHSPFANRKQHELGRLCREMGRERR